MKRKICALVMCGALFVAMMPSSVLADVEDNSTQTEEATESAAEGESVSTDQLNLDDDSYVVEIGSDDAEAIVIEDAAGDDAYSNADEDAEGSEAVSALKADPDVEEDAEEDEADKEDVLYKVETDGVIVEVTAPADALPDNAELSVKRFAEDSEDYKEAAEAIDFEDTDENGMAALDISFIADGAEVEPTEPVKVSIDVAAILPADADKSTLEVQHLVENDYNEEVKPVVVANDSAYTEGTIDKNKAVAEFKVDSFSAFTVTWTIENGPQSGTTYTVNVTAYLDGTELNGITNLTFNSENDELNFETLLSDVGYGTGDYTFSYAIATVGNTTYGTQGNPIVAIEIEAGTGGGPTGSSSNFVFVYMDGTTSDSVSTSSTVNVSAYYLTPDFSVSIEAVDEDEAEDWLLQAVLSHAGTYDHVGYEWTITNKDGTSETYATIGFSDTTGRVFIVWADDVEDDTEITVSVTATLYDAENNVLGTATDSYDLEYGDETVDLIMTYGPNKTALPADVTVTLTNTVTGKEYTGTTDSEGWVHDVEIEPGIYTVTATYTDSDGNTYQCNETVAMHDAGNYSINLNYYDESILTNVTDRDNWEHIDIKLSVGTTSTDASNENVSVDITKVVIYDGSTGAAKYTATEDSIERNDNEFQCSFYDGDGSTGTASHSISFSTSDTIEITYTLTWTSDDDPDYSRTETFTLIIDSSTVYSAGTTYPATGQRAYKLYNYLYGTSYSSDAQLVADGIDSVDIGGMSMMLVASILCDSSDVTGAGTVVAANGTGNQWGMDFAVSIDTFIELSTNWMFDIEKTYENHAMNAGDFTFYMYSANYDESSGYWHIETDDEGGWHYTLSNSTSGQGIDGNSSDTIENVYITFDDEMVRRNATHYYIICEDTGDLAYTTYDDTVFGAAVYVGVDETTGEPVVTATYYILTSNGDGTYTATEYSGDKITDDGDPTFHFTNTYQTGVQVQKQDMSGNGIDATFTLTQAVTDSDGTTTDYYYDAESGEWVEYTPGDSVTIPTFTLGTIDLGTPWDGTYTFTEVEAPDRYTALPDAVVVTIENGLLVSAVWADSSTEATLSDYVTIDDSGLNLYLKDDDNNGGLKVTKTFSGLSDEQIASLTDFTITVKNSGGDTVATLTLDDADESSSYTWTVSNLPAGTYTVTESGYTLDGYEVIVTSNGVEVTDSTTAEVTWGETSEAELTNTYTEVGSLSISKRVAEGSNATHLDVGYTVTVTASADVDLQWVKITIGDEDVTSSAKINSDEGTISFTIKNGETAVITGLPTGSYTVEESVEESDDFEPVYIVGETMTEGTPTVTVTSDSETAVEVVIENEYQVGTYIQVQKNYNNTVYPTGDNAFTFTIEALSCDLDATDVTLTSDEMPMPTSTSVTITDGNAKDFGTMTFEHFGTYYYKITETQGSLSYVDYDSSIYYVKIVVSASADEGEVYDVETAVESYCKCDQSYDDNEAYKNLEYTEADTIITAEFTNTYSAEGEVTLTATKTVSGGSLKASDFSFTITEVSEGTPYTETVIADTDGNITFSKFEYTLDDETSDVGTYTYTIQEVIPEGATADNGYTLNGITYDPTVYTVVITVTDEGDGTLSTVVTVNGVAVEGSNSIYDAGNFGNSYEAIGDVTLTATKTISGMDSTVKTFNFALYNSDENFTYDIGNIRATKSTTDTLTEGVAQTVTFPTITYTAAGTYYFVIIESSQGVEGDGWTYDSTEYHVTVVMTDDENGNLIPTVTYEYVDESGETQTAESADFTNTYKAAETSVQFAGTKYISNSNSTDKEFAFELYETEDSFDTTDVTPEEVKTSGSINASGQSFEFEKITYEEVGTHYYVIKEQELDKADGWTISETVYYITVDVTDNLAGQLEAKVSYVKEIGGDSTTVTGSEDIYGGFDFTNTYAAVGTVGLTAVKSLAIRPTSDTTFTFTLYRCNSEFDSSNVQLVETKATDGTIENSQGVSFSDIKYTYNASNTYPMYDYFIIKETTTDGNGWTCDTGEYHVTVTVTDDGTGTLTTSPSYVYVDANGEESSADNATFTNTYAATGALNLSGTKTFEGGTITDGQFTYTVMEGETQVATGTVAADGTITFTQIDYTYGDVGEHTYTITEDAGSDTSVQYDETEYTVVVTVTDNETGDLDVTYTVNGTENGDITFTNYQNGSLIITKAFTGLTDDQIESLTDFTITVINSNDETVATLTLDNVDEGSAYTWTVSNLPADTYTVTETGYSLDGYEVIAKSGTVEVTDGSDVAVDDALAWGGEDTLEFTNDYTEVGTIEITKYVTAEEDIQDEHADTEYTVVITADKDADFQWVTVKSDSGREITPTIDGKTITFTITEYETVTISGLPAGDYTVEEQGSDAMTSEHCVPTYIVGEKETEEAPTVTVASGSDNVVAVVIENEYPIGTYIMVQKDYNKDEYPDEGFTFTIEALSCDPEAKDVTIDAEDMPMPDSATVTLTESGEIGYFGNIEYEHLGTYYYKITETAGSEENVDYDTSVHYIKVVVAAKEGTYVETTDEFEAKADAETDDYKNLEYTEAGIVTAKFTNTAYEELSIEKEVAGNPGDTSEYEFEITLINSDGTPFDGIVTLKSGSADDSSGSNFLKKISSNMAKLFSTNEDVTFTDGKATVTVTAGEKITLLIPSGVTCTITETTTGADTTTVYDADGNVIVQAKGTTTEATAELGTIADSTQVKFVNSYRAYYPIDEEIVTDTDDIFDKDAWVKDEAVNEYNAIEIEMTTNLPTVTAYDLENGEFTMNFHEVLDHELVLDEDAADFSVYIAGTAISTAYYRITFDEDTGDDCNFHVDVDLTALYNDGVVTEDMLDGNTEITIFFFADLEGTGLNGSYTSTIWYEIYDGYEDGELLYTSNVSVVAVYTYEIEIWKYDSETNESLAGATLGVYYDKDCTNPVSRNGEPYTEVSGEDGMVIFYGLADGTYYVSEIAAPTGYSISDEVLEVVLGEDLNDSGYAYEGEFANTPKEAGLIDIGGYKTWSGDEESDRPDSITIRLLANGEEVDSKTVTSADGWKWSFTDLDECDENDNVITYTITEDEVEGYDTAVNDYNVTNTYSTSKEKNPNPTGTNNPNPTGTNNPNPTGTNNPEPTTPSKTADADLPVLPIAGCCVAFALIACALIIRRREADE